MSRRQQPRGVLQLPRVRPALRPPHTQLHLLSRETLFQREGRSGDSSVEHRRDLTSARRVRTVSRLLPAARCRIQHSPYSTQLVPSPRSIVHGVCAVGVPGKRGASRIFLWSRGRTPPPGASRTPHCPLQALCAVLCLCLLARALLRAAIPASLSTLPSFAGPPVPHVETALLSPHSLHAVVL